MEESGQKDGQRVLDAVARFPQGAAVRQLLEDPQLGLSKRTLQRRLDRLVTAGHLRAVGRARARCYVPVHGVCREDALRTAVVREEPRPQPPGALLLSAEAEALRHAVQRPQSERRPVGYVRAFLEGYVPNRTAYLSEALRRKLSALGRVEAADQPAGTHLRRILDRLLIDLSWNSSRLEGNTYSLLETQRLLEQGLLAEGKAAREAQMILNHKAAIEMLADQAEEIGFNRYTLFNLHAALADNLLPDPRAQGRLRACPVGISGTVFHPLEQPAAVESAFDLLLEKAAAIEDAFEQAFFVMVHLPYLQPFEDVNKRVSRLAANIPLVRRNLCPLSFVDMPREDYIHGLIAVYELNRVELLRDVFAWAYERSCARYAAVRQAIGDPDVFRLRHRDALRRCVARVVRDSMDAGEAARWIAAEAAAELPEAERSRFIELVETELLGLHAGKSALYRLRPSEFEAWQKRWNAPRTGAGGK